MSIDTLAYSKHLEAAGIDRHAKPPGSIAMPPRRKRRR